MKQTFPKVASLSKPQAEKRDLEIVQHGHTRVDSYAWLRDDKWQEVLKDPSVLQQDIRTYLEAENDYTKQVLEHTEDFQAKLFEELKGRIKEDDTSVPTDDGEYSYFRKFETGKQYPIYARKAISTGNESIVLDVNVLAEGKEYCKVGAMSHSPNHQYLAYAVDENGSEIYEIRILDLNTGKYFDDKISQCSNSIEWAADNKTLFYAVLDDNHRSKWIKRHELGQDPDNDPVIYEEPDDGMFLDISMTESRKYILIESHDHTTSEVRFLLADNPTQEPQLFSKRNAGRIYELNHHGDYFYVLLREKDQKDGCILRCPEQGFDFSKLEAYVPFQEGCLLEDMLFFKDYLVRLEIRDALAQIVLKKFSDGSEQSISFQEEAYDLSLMPGYEFDTQNLRFVYSSFTTPQQVFDYNMQSGERELRKQVEIPSGHNPSDYITKRVNAPSWDGESIPITLLHHKDCPLDGSAALLLYGYGSYGISMPAAFSPNRLSLANRNIIYACTHIRGGKERGYRWYAEGKLSKKPNSFKDFISCAEHLIKNNYTQAGNIIAHGGSAGGMLMGAIANMRPELFGAVIASVPFVDVLNTMSDKELPLTPPEWPEWGNPIENEQAYKNILAYSPYENVEAKDYPAMLIMAGLTDPRVTYWEPAKWLAKLRELKTDDNALLLHLNMGAGHGGASGRFDFLHEVALMYAFILDLAETSQ